MEKTQILIGWAQADITPPQPVMLWGQFHTRVSRGVLDSLTATALALECGDDAAIIVSCDLVSITSALVEAVRRELGARTDEFNPDKLLLCATHTHTGPVYVEGIYSTDDPDVMSPAAYLEYASTRIADAAAEAWSHRAPGTVGWGLGHAVLGRNRRTTYADGHAVMYGSTADEVFEGFEDGSDSRVQVLATWDESRTVTGVAVNLACPAQLSEQAYYVSSDFWHEARSAIRERVGDDVFVLAQCSAAGDQSPHVLLGKQAEDRMLQLGGMGVAVQARLAQAGLDDADSDCRLARREYFGHTVAEVVSSLVPLLAEDTRCDIPFAHRVSTLHLPVRMVTETEKQQAGTELQKLRAMADDPAKLHRRIVRAESLITRHAQQQPSDCLHIEAHFLRIGDVAMATNPFELFMHYGLQMTARSPALQTFVVQLAGCAKLGTGDRQLGGMYLPTRRAVQGGSYSANVDDNFVGPEGGDVLVAESVRALQALWNDRGSNQ